MASEKSQTRKAFLPNKGRSYGKSIGKMAGLFRILMTMSSQVCEVSFFGCPGDHGDNGDKIDMIGQPTDSTDSTGLPGLPGLPVPFAVAMDQTQNCMTCSKRTSCIPFQESVSQEFVFFQHVQIGDAKFGLLILLISCPGQIW